MKVFIVTSLLACLASTVYSEVCKDQHGEATCQRWIKSSWFCKQKNAVYFCKKSCGLCKVGPTQAPVTRATFPTRPTSMPSSGPSTCGKSTVQQSRIVNGVDAKPGAWPWIASLQRSSRHFCGATILTPTWILTASHCVEKMTRSNLRSFSVVLGAHNHRSSEKTQQKKSIKRVIMHPSYNRTTLRSDMALIELNNPAILNSRVTVPCLPQRGVYPSIGKQCYLAGWGTILHPGSIPNTLQQTRLPVVKARSCKHNPEVVCVGNGFKKQANGKQQPNACRGDSGGPLVCQQSDGRWQLEGVASFVYTYCKYYTGYSPVNKYLDWINSYIRT